MGNAPVFIPIAATPMDDHERAKSLAKRYRWDWSI